jgi:hypothetical protein
LTSFLTALISLRAAITCLPTWRTGCNHSASIEWVDARFQNVAELTDDRLLWHRHIKTYSPIQAPQFRRWRRWEVAEVRMYLCIQYISFLIVSFVSSSLEVTFQIALVFERRLFCLTFICWANEVCLQDGRARTFVLMFWCILI